MFLNLCTRKEFEKEIKKYEQEIKKMKWKIIARENRIKNLNDELNAVKTKDEEFIETIKELKEKNNEMFNSHMRKEKIISDLENKNAALHTEKMSLKIRYENDKNIKKGMEAGAEILRKEIKKLKEENEILKKTIETFNNKIKEIELKFKKMLNGKITRLEAIKARTKRFRIKKKIEKTIEELELKSFLE
ncbi:hypothetical protein [Clostridioides difficile]|uniref:hypothetical protein n=1 Tax=Clostridioides difficile TaxID=1496 RepID=UPI002961E379|nr:hypothetical protein [Clostridioides difficile]